MSQKKTFNGAVKNHDFDVLVRFQRCDDFVELRNSFRAKDVEGRVIKRDAPIRGGSSRQKNPFSRGERFNGRSRGEISPCGPAWGEFNLGFGFHIRNSM